jgi:polyisoprenoid-binding protein YceI
MQTLAGHTAASAPPISLTNPALIGGWWLDPQKSSLRLRSRNLWGLVPVKGVFREISGTGTVAPTGEITGTVTVTAASIDTQNTRRDTHLRSGDFFDSNNHPHITFTVEGVTLFRDKVTVAGALAVRGRTRRLHFDTVASIQGDGDISLDGEVRINRTDFGLAWNFMRMASMSNALIFRLVFIREGP